MKKFIALAIVALCVSCMAGGYAESSVKSGVDVNEKIKIVATIFPEYDFARAIAGDTAELTMLLSPGAESHSYEPTPRDIIRIQNCDVFIYVGGESDQWVRSVLGSMDTSKMRIITIMDCVSVVEEETVEGMQSEEESNKDSEEEAEYDEHVWTSPRNAKLIASRIADTLCEVDVANADYYRTNEAEYLARLDELDAQFRAVVDAAARKTIIFGDRFPFRYFADAYELEYFAAFPGCATETEASAATIKFLIDKINAERIPVIFHIELSNERMAMAISESTGAAVRLLHACHNITKADFEAGETYLSLMAKNVAALEEALR